MWNSRSSTSNAGSRDIRRPRRFASWRSVGGYSSLAINRETPVVTHAKGASNIYEGRAGHSLTDHQIQQREKDLIKTKTTIGYSRYIGAVPPPLRQEKLASSWHPVTPRASQGLTVSQWRTILRNWRVLIHRWRNFSESAYAELLQLPLERRADFLESLPYYETGCGDTTTSLTPSGIDTPPETTQSAALRMIQPPENNILRGKTASEEMVRKLLNRPPSTVAHPVLFLPSWFSGNIFMKGFEVVREEELEANLNAMLDKLVKDSGALQRTLCSESASELSRFVGGSSQKLVQLTKSLEAPTATETQAQEVGGSEKRSREPWMAPEQQKMKTTRPSHSSQLLKEKPTQLERLRQLPSLSMFRLSMNHPTLSGKIVLGKSQCLEKRNARVKSSDVVFKRNPAKFISKVYKEPDSLSKLFTNNDATSCAPHVNDTVAIQIDHNT